MIKEYIQPATFTNPRLYNMLAIKDPLHNNLVLIDAKTY